MPTIPVERVHACARSDTRRSSPSSLKTRSLAALLADDSIRPRTAIFGDWLLQRGLTMLYAPTGIGKSWLSLSVACAVAGGGTIHNWSAERPVRVLYVDGEMDIADLKNRLGQISQMVGGDPDAMGSNLELLARHDQPSDSAPFPDLADPTGQEKLISIVRSKRPGLIVLDNVSTLVPVVEENAAESWNSFLSFLQRLQLLNTAVVVVHHSSKSGGYRGSSKLAVLFDNIIALATDPTALGHPGAAFRLSFEKARTLVGEHRNGTAFKLTDEGWITEAQVDAELLNLVQRVRNWDFRFQREIAGALGVDPATVTRMKRKAIAAGLITKDEWEEHLQSARDELVLEREEF